SYTLYTARTGMGLKIEMLLRASIRPYSAIRLRISNKKTNNRRCHFQLSLSLYTIFCSNSVGLSKKVLLIAPISRI
ncbi:MAG: hypothetical protein RR351_04240, partial [Christensenella sp.]